MTRYQEEMLARVMELHMLAKAEGAPLPPPTLISSLRNNM